jgi:hypothetical protein
MKFIKKLIVPFAFDFRNIHNLIIDKLSVVIKISYTTEEKEIFLENFYFFIRKENEKNKLIVRENNNLYFDLSEHVLRIINEYPDNKKRLETFEDNIKDNLNLSYSYANRKGSRFFKGEHLILQDLQKAYNYFNSYFKKGEKWKEAEDLFSTDSRSSLKYAIKTEELFPKGEDAISKDIKNAIEYAKNFNIRFKKCEEYLLESKSLNEIINYLKILREIGETWEEGEEKVFSTSLGAFLYCKDVIKGRDLRAEKAILNPKEYQPNLITSYAIEVIYGRWKEGEERIVAHLERNKHIDINYDFLYIYALNLSQRVPPFESFIIKSDKAMNYAIRVIKGRWPKLEKIISKFSPQEVLEYLDVTKYTWPEAEEKITAKNISGNYSSESNVEHYIKNIINDQNITPYVKNMIDDYFSEIKDKDHFIDKIFYKLEKFTKLNYFKEVFNKNLPKIIKMVDPNNIRHDIRDDYTYSNIKTKTLHFQLDTIIYRLYDDRFFKLMNDDNKKLLNDVFDKMISNAFKIIKEKKLYEYPLSYRGGSLTIVKDNNTIKKIIDLFNEQRSKEYAILNGKEEIKRINSIEDNKEREKAMKDNAELIKRTLSNIIKYN